MSSTPFPILPSGQSFNPQVSGNSSIGGYATPFASGMFNNYLTTRASGAVTTAITTVNWSNGASQILTFANGQPSGTTLLFSGMNAGSSYVLETINNASGTANITWPSSVKWQNGSAATITPTGSSNDLFSFYSKNGTNSFGNASFNFL